MTVTELPAHCGTMIVGGGLAGMELARELSARGASDILVLEAGPDRDLRHINTAHEPAHALRIWLDPEHDPHFERRWSTASPPHYAGGSGLRRRLGGRSLYWYGVLLPVEDWALQEPWWPAEIVKDLTRSWEGDRPLYERVYEDCLPDGEQPGPGLKIGGTLLTATPRAVRADRHVRGRWRAYSPLDHWRDPSGAPGWRDLPGVRVCCDTEVLSVQVRGGRVRAVVVSRSGAAPRTMAADTVVLAGGTLENSRLAIQSLAEAGGSTPPRLTGLVDHIVQGFMVRLPPGALAAGALSPGSFLRQGAADERFNLFVDVIDIPDAGGAVIDVRATGEQTPHEQSFVECLPDTTARWPTRVTTALCATDRVLVSRQREALEQLWRDLSEVLGLRGRRLEFTEFDQPARTNALALPDVFDRLPAGRPFTWSSPLGTEDHEGGTLPLGGVLDTRHRFKDLPGLYAAGPSTFPRMGAANPALTSLALARRLAAVIADGPYERQTRV